MPRKKGITADTSWTGFRPRKGARMHSEGKAPCRRGNALWIAALTGSVALSHDLLASANAFPFVLLSHDMHA